VYVYDEGVICANGVADFNSRLYVWNGLKNETHKISRLFVLWVFIFYGGKMKHYLFDGNAVLEEVKSNENGLTQVEADARLEQN
jgi:hypothetical protein